MYEVVLRSEMGIYGYNVCKENSDNNKDNNDNKHKKQVLSKNTKILALKRGFALFRA